MKKQTPQEACESFIKNWEGSVIAAAHFDGNCYAQFITSKGYMIAWFVDCYILDYIEIFSGPSGGSAEFEDNHECDLYKVEELCYEKCKESLEKLENC